jgi:cell division ATPase FtsA
MRNVIVLDIGTQYVKAKLSDVFVKENCSEDVLSSCKKAIKKLLKKSKIKSEDIVLGVNNDILKGKTTALCFRRENPYNKIDSAELKYLIQKLEWRALDNIRKEFREETEFKDTEIKIIDAFITDIKVDNRLVVDPVGDQGQNICLSIYNVYASSQVLENLEKLVVDLKMNLVSIVPISYALYRHLGLDKLQKSGALIVDIGGKLTEITLIKNNGEIIETKNFHLGGQIVNQALANFLGLKPEDVENIKIQYKNGISAEAKKKIDKLFIPSTSFWFKGFKIILKDFSEKHNSLPNKIFLCGGGSKMPFIETNLKKEKNLRILNIEDLNNESLSCVALDQLSSNLLDGKNTFSPILKRVIKLIQN